MLLRRAIFGLLVYVLALAGGCAMPDKPPGDLVGAYHVDGALMENSCGSVAVPAADPLRFDVEVRVQDGSGLWLTATPPAFPGRLEDDGDFQFERESAFAVNANGQQPSAELQTEMDIEALADPERLDRIDRAQQQPCTLLIGERVSGKLVRRLELDGGLDGTGNDVLDFEAEGGADAADLIGENEIRFRASGGGCDIVLEDNGGPFAELPCSVRYDLQGELVEADDDN